MKRVERFRDIGNKPTDQPVPSQLPIVKTLGPPMQLSTSTHNFLSQQVSPLQPSLRQQSSQQQFPQQQYLQQSLQQPSVPQQPSDPQLLMLKNQLQQYQYLYAQGALTPMQVQQMQLLQQQYQMRLYYYRQQLALYQQALSKTQSGLTQQVLQQSSLVKPTALRQVSVAPRPSLNKHGGYPDSVYYYPFQDYTSFYKKPYLHISTLI